MKIFRLSNEQTLRQLRGILEKLDCEEYSLYFEDDFEIHLKYFRFDYEEQTYFITDVSYEDNEIPLLSAIRVDASLYISQADDSWEIDYDDDLETCHTEGMGYYTKDERPYYMPSDFMSHTEWTFQPGGKYSWNIPGIPNHTLIGFYWIPLTSVLSVLNEEQLNSKILSNRTGE
ncbi:hypothetical protein BSK66_32395 [Paenibacillus odorifer]|uniref:hypothetical protein n=1 Tax=Paenibacillus TaxID=44249 RepID=UPI0003E225EA|nr:MULTISPECIES: hypothetical protein [Paenibacillus]ETT53750.1 hypothetical protein C171_21234 [Paenibacillus sp. FSL H8-237]OMD07725.1 hypothetical protein BJP47_30320 [Paenibacillus odorifer]OME46032.1 hypothetical protein BSK66_32395 [Paenibacillus odorifer]